MMGVTLGVGWVNGCQRIIQLALPRCQPACTQERQRNRLSTPVGQGAGSCCLREEPVQVIAAVTFNA
jgi:hypothetical protein